MFNQGIHFSSGWDIMVNFEETFLATMVARGFAVVVTDGIGLGIPGAIPQFANRLAAGQAMLDAARAAMHLPGTSLDPHGPVALWGYASGGQASASAAELAPRYAPELKLVGAWAGAAPADLAAMLPYMDGSQLVGAVGYLLNGIAAAFPEATDGLMTTLTPRGVDLVTRTRDQCFVQTMIDFAFRHVQPYFNTDLDQLVSSQPLKGILDLQRLGTLRPATPVMLDSNRFDPFVPYTSVHQLAQDWCAKGADVQLWTNEQPPFLNKTDINHLLTYWVDGERSMQWIADRFNGAPTTPNCMDLDGRGPEAA
jgi:triacylglycerol lipase